MLNLTPVQIRELADLALISDKEIRSDMALGMIYSEDDYTSNFTGALRRNINCHSKTGIKATSHILPTQIEQSAGCDATIIIQSNGYAKVLLFEAKWPRMSKKGYRWDYKQTSTGLSHYSDQIDRQAQQPSIFAIFEMFYCEYDFYKQPSYMKDVASTCVWHHDALNFKNSRSHPDNIWSQADLKGMLKTGNYTIAEIISDVCSCKEGQAISTGDSIDFAYEFQLTGEILVINFLNENNKDE